MKLLTTIAAVLISISAFSQEKLIYHGDGIITQGLDTISLGDFERVCKAIGLTLIQRVDRRPSSLLPRKIQMTYGKAIEKSLAGQSEQETIKYNSKKKGLGLAELAFGYGLILWNLVDFENNPDEADWVRPVLGLAIGSHGLMGINDVSKRSNHKYQSDVYFEVIVSSYNNYTSRRFQR